MRIPLNQNNKLKLLGAWTGIVTILGVCFSLLLSVGFPSHPFSNLLIACLLHTYLVSGFVLTTSYALGYMMHHRALWTILIVNNAGVAIALWLAFQLLAGIDSLFRESGDASMIGITRNLIVVPALLLALLMNTAGIFIERFRHSRNRLARNFAELNYELVQSQKSKSTRKDNPNISIHERGNHYVLNYDEIVYVSSAARKSVLHTRGRDYEVSELLKETGKRILDPRFIRIHKQFIVNIEYVDHLKYNQGGRYNLFLKDEDDSVLPVGAAYTAALKKRLNID